MYLRSLPIEYRDRAGHSATIAFENIWWIKNDIRLGGDALDWFEFS